MKKVLLGILVLTFFLPLVYSQSITVIAPATGETVNKGEIYVVRWTSTGSMAETVKIRLFDSTGTTRVLGITDSVETSAGRFRCPATLFNSVPDGRYVVKVRTTDNRVEDNSGIFTLGNPAGPEPDPDPDPDPDPEPGRDDCFSLLFSQPRSDGSTNWAYGSRVIRWSMRISPPCDPPDNVRLELRNEANTSTVLTITSSTANNGRYHWTIPGTVAIGNYKIRMTTLGDNPVVVTSGVFHVGLVVLSTIPLDLRVIDISGRITNRELKVAYMKSFRWRIKCKVRVTVSPDSANLENVVVYISLYKRGDSTERHFDRYVIGSLRGGEEHVYTYDLEAGDNKNKKKRPRLEEGDYYIEVKLDPDDNKRDRNLRNNTLRWNFNLNR